MDLRSFEAGAAGTPPAAPGSPSVGYPTNGNPITPIAATKPGDYWFHQIAEELRNVVVGGGLTPAAGTLTQLLDALRSITSSAVLVNRTSSQSIPADTATIISWQAESYDDAGMWSVGTPTRVTVPTGATHARLIAGVSFDQKTGGERHLKVLKNGGQYNGLPWIQIPPSPNATTDSMTVAGGWVPVVATDYFEMEVLFVAPGSATLVGNGAAQLNSTYLFMEIKR